MNTKKAAGAAQENSAKVANICENANHLKENPLEKEGKELDVLADSAKSGMPQLILNKHGEYDNCAANLRIIAEFDKKLKSISYDIFRDKFVTEQDSIFKGIHGNGIDDNSLAEISAYIEMEYNIKISVAKIEEKILYVIRSKRGFHPIKDFILKEQWDGTPRIETLLVDYLGAGNTILTRTITRKWMVAAVARIFEPGCKFDYVLTLAGRERMGKSSFFRTISGGWFTDNFSFSMDTNRQREALQGNWIVEIAELAGMRKAEVEAAKAFISTQEDQWRKAYGRMVTTHPRQCVLAATTNEENFLRSMTGDRRWWVVDVSGTRPVAEWLPELSGIVNQLWAEAYSYYQSGEALFLTEDLEHEAERMQAKHNVLEESPLIGELSEWLDEYLPSNWNTLEKAERANYFKYGSTNYLGNKNLLRQYVCVAEVMNEFTGKIPVNFNDSKHIGMLLDRVSGWERLDKPRRFPKYGTQRGWERKQNV